MRRHPGVKHAGPVPPDQQVHRHPGPQLIAAACGLGLTALAANAVRQHLGDRVPFARWTVGETTMWVLALSSCVALFCSGSWLSWRLPTNRTGVCLTIAGFALAASIYGRYPPTRASPWAERLFPTIATAAIVVAVSRWPTGRMRQRSSKPFRLAVLVFVLVGIGSRFVFADWLPQDGPWWPAHFWDVPTWADAATSAVGRNVVA